MRIDFQLIDPISKEEDAQKPWAQQLADPISKEEDVSFSQSPPATSSDTLTQSARLWAMRQAVAETSKVPGVGGASRSMVPRVVPPLNITSPWRGDATQPILPLPTSSPQARDSGAASPLPSPRGAWGNDVPPHAPSSPQLSPRRAGSVSPTVPSPGPLLWSPISVAAATSADVATNLSSPPPSPRTFVKVHDTSGSFGIKVSSNSFVKVSSKVSSNSWRWPVLLPLEASAPNKGPPIQPRWSQTSPSDQPQLNWLLSPRSTSGYVDHGNQSHVLRWSEYASPPAQQLPGAPTPSWSEYSVPPVHQTLRATSPLRVSEDMSPRRATSPLQAWSQYASPPAPASPRASSPLRLSENVPPPAQQMPLASSPWRMAKTDGTRPMVAATSFGVSDKALQHESLKEQSRTPSPTRRSRRSPPPAKRRTTETAIDEDFDSLPKLVRL